ncbi:SusD/RagB family nutrient-binding outer membrane lipoprotein [Fulvivirgaceae bacterium BMA12]|uniref:SusD/RagB family nutrient-binding outer membrane lipoprotein n=1 Tax=Agaribacillus aureus TaxID=3051825 RepID=A0ABT8L247_9BACT|nr:SusD/RagB family nutrient-binding outer membrane lipoprotein [Fulvivirgaceae bacterium BMA12]
MKINRLFKVFCLMAVISVACTDDFKEINTNPNAQTVGSNEGLLLGAQIRAARELLDNVRSNNHGMSKWVQYSTEQLDNLNDFVQGNPREDYNDFWIYQILYTQTLPLIERIIGNTDEAPHPNYRAAAYVMKAWIFQTMTDQWGSIPFSDALKGEVSEEERFNKPKFDTQQEIYTSVLTMLEEANTMFDLGDDPGVAMVAASDAFAGGDVLMWKKFANTLRARILLRISDVDEGTARAGLEQIFSNPTTYPVMESNDDNFGITWEDVTGSYADPLGRYLNDNGFTPNVGSGFVNILGDRLDPRMKVLVAPAEGYTNADTYIGIPPGFDPDNPSGFTRISRDSVSQISTQFAEVQLRPIITYSELLFIKAEAALKGFNVGVSGEDAYEDGITANMQDLGIDAAEIDTYINQPSVAYNATDALELIITQRYIAQFGQSTNTFAMIRRTGYPELDYFTIGIYKDDGYPVRIQYNEGTIRQFNEVNFEKAIEGVTIINRVFGDNLWFATNAPGVKMKPNLQTGPVLYSY